jgi:hypothetical protein
MGTPIKLLFTGLLAALTLAALGGTGSGNRISISEQRFLAIWPREAQLNVSGSGFEVACELTLEGSFHYSTFLKTRSLVGHITRARLGPIENCSRRNGITSYTILGTNAEGRLTTPWPIFYDSFSGRLPRMEGIRLGIVGLEKLIQESIFGESCLYRSTAARPAFGIVNIETNGRVTGLTADRTSEIPYDSGGFGFCPSSGTYTGTGRATTPAGGTITVRLI